MLTRIRAQFPAWRRSLRRRRRTLAVLAVALLLAVLAPSLIPPGFQGSTVVVASSDLPAGTLLTTADLREVQIAAELVPPGAVAIKDDLLGRETIADLPAGTPLLPALLDAKGPAAAPAGSVLMAIPIPAVLRAQMSPGDEIEILSTAPDSTTPTRVPARIVELPDPGSDQDALVSPASGEQPQVLVAVERHRAGDLAHSLHDGWMSIALIS